MKCENDSRYCSQTASKQCPCCDLILCTGCLIQHKNRMSTFKPFREWTPEDTEEIGEGDALA